MVKTEGKYAAEFILSEANGTQSRDTVGVIVPAGEKLEPGQTLGVLENGSYAPYDADASDGSEVGYAILYSELDNSEGDAPAEMEGVVINWSAEVRGEDLVYVDEDDADAFAADVAERGIKVRE